MNFSYISSKLVEFWNIFQEVWHHGIFGIDISKFLTSIFIILFFLVIRQYISKFIFTHLKSYALKTETKIDDKVVDAIEQPLKIIPITLGLFFAFEYLDIENTFGIIGDHIVKSLVSISIFWMAHNLVDPFQFIFKKISIGFTKAIREWVSKFIKALIILLGIANVLETWGIKVAPIIAGLGLFGVAVALGAQDLFKNLISGILIIAEKRFNTGDWICVDGVVEGTVESIGFRSTVVRRFDKAPVYVPNSKLSDTAVTNFTAMTHRRIRWVIGVEYSTSIEQLRKIRDQIEEYVSNNEDFAPANEVSTFVRIDSFNDSSIDILLYCFTKTTNWGEWLKIKEALAYKVKDIVEGAGSGFAFPSRSVYFEKDGSNDSEVFVPPSSKTPKKKK